MPTEKQFDAETLKLSTNVLNQMESIISILRRTPDFQIVITDMTNLFNMIMDILKDEMVYNTIMNAFKSEPYMHNSFRAILHRYKKDYNLNVEYLTQEEFMILEQNGLVLHNEYELMTGTKFKEDSIPHFSSMGMDPSISPEHLIANMKDTVQTSAFESAMQDAINSDKKMSN